MAPPKSDEEQIKEAKEEPEELPKVKEPKAKPEKLFGTSDLYKPYVYQPKLYKSTGMFDPTQIEHCPDFDERMTLVDGTTRAVPYPHKGFNCNANWGLA